MALDDYLSLLPGASREKERFMALAEAMLRQAADLISLTAQLQSGFSFAEAEGIQLDRIAEVIGLSRESGMTDADFREYLFAKFALWTWNGTNKGVPGVLALALSGTSENDNQDGTVTVTPSGIRQDLLPVSAGVRIAT